MESTLFKTILLSIVLLGSCKSKHICTHSIEEVKMIDTVIIDIPHMNLGIWCFPSRKDTIIDETTVYIEYISFNKNN